MHGFFVMPILRGDRLVGRVDPVLDRKSKRLVVNAVHAEEGVGAGKARRAAGSALTELASLVGAEDLAFDSK